MLPALLQSSIDATPTDAPYKVTKHTSSATTTHADYTPTNAAVTPMNKSLFPRVDINSKTGKHYFYAGIGLAIVTMNVALWLICIQCANHIRRLPNQKAFQDNEN